MSALVMRLARIAAQAVLPATILFGAFWLTGQLTAEEDVGSGSTVASPEITYAVTAQDALVTTNRATLRAFGKVVPAEVAELRVASPGEVVEIHPSLEAGEIVAAGTPLVTIDPFDYAGAVREAKAQLAEAEAALDEAGSRIRMQETTLARSRELLDLAVRDLERAEQLSRSGTVTPQTVEARQLTTIQRRQAVEEAEIAIEAEVARRAQTKASIDRLRWQVDKATRALEDTVLKAPFTGIVREESVALGRLLQANDVAVSLVRANALDVEFVLSNQRYGRLVRGGSLIGAPVAVIWRIGDEPITYRATITRVGADIDADTGGVTIYARLILPDDGAVPRPGAFVEVEVPGRPHDGSVRVAAEALYNDRVFVIGPDERLEARDATLLARFDGDVILRAAVSDGEAIMTTRLAEVGDGIKVRRVTLDGAPDEPTDGEPAPDPPTAEQRLSRDAPPADVPQTDIAETDAPSAGTAEGDAPPAGAPQAETEAETPEVDPPVTPVAVEGRGQRTDAAGAGGGRT